MTATHVTTIPASLLKHGIALMLCTTVSGHCLAETESERHRAVVEALLSQDQQTVFHEPNSDQALIQRLIEMNAGHNGWVEASIQSYQDLASRHLGLTDQAIVRQLYEAPRSRLRTINLSPEKQVRFLEQMLANTVNQQLMNHILVSDSASSSSALRGLKALEARYQVKLYVHMQARHQLTRPLDDENLYTQYLASRDVADLDLSRLLAQKILDRNPFDIETRRDLISLLDGVVSTHLANDHRMTLALLEKNADENANQFSVVPEGLATESRVLELASASVSEPSQAEPRDLLPEDFETQTDYLAEQIFQDPANLSLNLQYFRAQVAEGDLEGAEVTLERILLIDPESKFAKILMAETQIKLGKLPEARNILNRLLASDDLLADMRSQALNYVDQIESILSPITWSGSVGLTAGISHNALGRTESGSVLYRDFTLVSGQPDVDVSFSELSFDGSMIYQLPYETPTTVTVTGFGLGRESDHNDLSRTSTVGGSASLKEVDDGVVLESSLTLAQTRVGGQPYANFASLAASLITGLTESLALGSNLAYSETMYQDFDGIVANKDNSGESVVAGLSLMGQVKQVGWSVTGKWADNNAKNASVSSDLESLAVALNYGFDNCRNTLSADRTWTRAKAANVFVSAQPKKVTQTNWVYGGACTMENFWSGVSLEPSFRFLWRDADSNIPNYTKESSEYSLGLKLRF